MGFSRRVSCPCRFVRAPFGFLLNPAAAVLGKTLTFATEKLLIEDKSPTRRLGGSIIEEAITTWPCIGLRRLPLKKKMPP